MSGLKGVEVLVVDDAADVLDVLTMLLRLEGANVVGVASGRDALTVFRERPFDLVVSDLDLPDTPGDVLGSPARALAAGAGAIFTKPCGWGQIVRHLEGLGLPAAARGRARSTIGADGTTVP
jgi:two-component system CheB/CheR fusion protein